ncbi:MAG TPA: hypothetical protein VE591_04155 [Candidatus Acidoferrum sp.]|nr:hypothetical protein [Candidatus Acidoferrum sp.]
MLAIAVPPPAHVACIRIVHVADTLSTRVALTPAMLLRIATLRVTIADREHVAQLVAAIAATPSQPDTQAADSRWGVALFDERDAPLLTIYLDRFGERAVIDGRPARVRAKPLVRLLAQVVR